MVTHAKDIVDKMQRRVIAIEKGRIVRDEEGQYGYQGGRQHSVVYFITSSRDLVQYLQKSRNASLLLFLQFWQCS